MLMAHPIHGAKEIDAEWQHKFIANGWELVKTKEMIEAEIRAEVEAEIRAEMAPKRGRPFKVG